MKKGLIFAALALVIMMFASCRPAAKATVSVTVTKAGVPQPGLVVYMFDGDSWVGDLTDPFDASHEVVTEEDGVAVFSLNILDFNVLDDQTTLYFAVFNNSGDIRGSVAKTVKKGDNVRATIELDK